MRGNLFPGRLVSLAILSGLVCAGALIPFSCAALPGNSPDTAITVPTLNVTNASVPNPPVLSEFRETLRPVEVRVTVGETALPGPKGEMAAGPRAIGVSVDPLVLATGILVLVVAGCGVLLYLKRLRPDNTDDSAESLDKK